MVWFLPFAVELSQKGPFEIIGNKYSAEVCDMARLKNVTHTPGSVLNPPPGAIAARIRRYGEKNYREIYAEATGCDVGRGATWAALEIEPEHSVGKKLLFDTPRASGLGNLTYTPHVLEFSREMLRVGKDFETVAPVGYHATLRELFVTVANASAGIGQIGFLTALCYLFSKPFYAVRGNNEPDDKFEARKKVVLL